MSTPDLTPDQLMAAEYVLGLLEAEALLQARGRVAREPEFAAAVAWWERALAPLLDELAGADPGPELWNRVEALLGEEGVLGSGEVVTLRRRLKHWQATAAIAMAASLAALVFALLPLVRAPVTPAVEPQPVVDAPAAPPLIADVPIANTALRVAVLWLPERRELLVTAAGLQPDGVHDHELWLLADEGTPRSLGLVRPGQATRVALAPEIAELIRAGSRVALSREPLGGKPPAAEVGPVVAQGTFART